jgi:hypothetical protein
VPQGATSAPTGAGSYRSTRLSWLLLPRPGTLGGRGGVEEPLGQLGGLVVAHARVGVLVDVDQVHAPAAHGDREPGRGGDHRDPPFWWFWP